MKISIISLIAIASVNAQSVSFSFGSDTWDYASGPSTVGFLKQTPANSTIVSSGSVTKNGVTMKFGASFVGGADSGTNYSGLSSGSSMTFAPTGQNPSGFLLTTNDNDSTGLSGTSTSSSLSGNVTKYQRWHFEFSSPITINSFLIQDIDNLSGGFRDILGAEGYIATGYNSAFNGNALNVSALPTAGSGIDPTFGLANNSELDRYTLNIGSQTLRVVSPGEDTNNPSSDPQHRANITFADTQIRAFSIYAISNQSSNHRMSLDNGVFQVTIPEPSVWILNVLSITCIVTRRRRA